MPIKLRVLVIFYLSYLAIFIPLSLYRERMYMSKMARFIDVGQGDAVLITTGKGKQILIDGGGNYEVDHYLAKFLSIGTCSLYMTITTHRHEDHFVGVERMLKRCRVVLPNPDLVKGDSFVVDGVQFLVLWPPFGSSFSDLNNSSKIILVKNGNFDILLTGDVSKEILCSLDLSAISGDLEVLKVSHHGSNTGLCEKIVPKTAVLSVGENKFGHPTKKVIDFYRKNGTRIYSTKDDGTVEIPF